MQKAFVVYKHIKILVFIFSLSGVTRGAAPHWLSRTTPLDLTPKSSSVGGIPLQHEHFSLRGLNLHSLKNGKVAGELAGAPTLLSIGMPQVPYLVRSFMVPQGFSPEVSLQNAVWEETAAPVNLVVTEAPYEWSPVPRLHFQREREPNRFLPGSPVMTQVSGGRAYVRVVPLQWDRATGKALRLVSGDLSVNLIGDESLFRPPVLWGVSSVILTSKQIGRLAEKLRRFHADRLGLSSEVVFVEDIAAQELPADESTLPGGYKDLSDRDTFVVPFESSSGRGFNYEKAKKVVRYFQRAMEGGALRSVTILGTAGLVPPSYYFGTHGTMGSQFTPTDRCYGALNKCTDVRVAVGRLPFRSEEDLSNYLEKAERFVAEAGKLPTELSLYGGHAFPLSSVYVGELGALNTLAAESVDWRSVKKIFQSAHRYHKDAVLDLVRNRQETAFVYYLDHGNGNQWFIDVQKNIYVTSDEILKSVSLPQAVQPVIASIACTNGAYDEELTAEPLFSNKAGEGGVSIGVALLKSKAGGVAYFGSARPAIGQPVYQVDGKGNVQVTGSNYGLQLLETFYEKYRLGRRGRLGDYFLQALQAYGGELGNDLSQPEHAWSFFLAGLLGDPALFLPERRVETQGRAIAQSITLFDDSLGFGLPLFHRGQEKLFQIQFEATVPVEGTLYKVGQGAGASYEGETLLQQIKFEKGKNNISVNVESEDSAGQYFLRLENAEGVPRERQVMVQVTND